MSEPTPFPGVPCAEIVAMIDEMVDARNKYTESPAAAFGPGLYIHAKEQHREASELINSVRPFFRKEHVDRWEEQRDRWKKVLDDLHDEIYKPEKTKMMMTMMEDTESDAAGDGESSTKDQKSTEADESNAAGDGESSTKDQKSTEAGESAQLKKEPTDVINAREALVKFRHDCLKITIELESHANLEETFEEVNDLHKKTLAVVKRAVAADDKVGTAMKKALRKMWLDTRGRFVGFMDDSDCEYEDPDLDPYSEFDRYSPEEEYEWYMEYMQGVIPM